MLPRMQTPSCFSRPGAQSPGPAGSLWQHAEPGPGGRALGAPLYLASHQEHCPRTLGFHWLLTKTFQRQRGKLAHDVCDLLEVLS